MSFVPSLSAQFSGARASFVAKTVEYSHGYFNYYAMRAYWSPESWCEQFDLEPITVERGGVPTVWFPMTDAGFKLHLEYSKAQAFFTTGLHRDRDKYITMVEEQATAAFDAQTENVAKRLTKKGFDAATATFEPGINGAVTIKDFGKKAVTMPVIFFDMQPESDEGFFTEKPRVNFPIRF